MSHPFFVVETHLGETRMEGYSFEDPFFDKLGSCQLFICKIVEDVGAGQWSREVVDGSEGS